MLGRSQDDVPLCREQSFRSSGGYFPYVELSLLAKEIPADLRKAPLGKGFLLFSRTSLP